ncbi:MAG: hypothetical protein NC911_05735 [Candidatus Omnitrophica bacterium]|nr:hypothetical protein [Candidatus Omnitrophota bacterium]
MKSHPLSARLVVGITLLVLTSSVAAEFGQRLCRYWPVNSQINLLENGTFSLAVGGLPSGWTLEGKGRAYIFNRGAYHAAGLEVTDSSSAWAMLVSSPVRIKDTSGTWVLTGLLGGSDQEGEVVPIDEEKKGGGVIEVRCYDQAGQRLPDAIRFVFQGNRPGLNAYREAKTGRIFRRFNLPNGTSLVRVAWGLDKAVGRVTADDLAFYRDTFLEKEPLPVVAFAPRQHRVWIKSGTPEAVVIDGRRDPGPEGDINPVLVGVAKYPLNRNLVQSFPQGVIFDLGKIVAIDGIEITLAVQVADVVDRRQERFEPASLHISFSDDGVTFTEPIHLLYQPELMQVESLVTLPYKGFRRLARYVCFADDLVLSEVRFLGEKDSAVLIGYRPIISLADRHLTYGVEIEASGSDDQSFLSQVPRGSIHRIDRKKMVELRLATPSGFVSDNIPLPHFHPEKITRVVYQPARSEFIAVAGADLKMVLRERVEIWDSPTTHAFKTDRTLANVEIKEALPPLPELIKLNQQLDTWAKKLKASPVAERSKLAVLFSAQMGPPLSSLGIDQKKIEELFSGFKTVNLAGPNLLPEIEFPTPDGKYVYRLARKSPDSFVIHKFEKATGRFLSGEGHRGNYITAGHVKCYQPRVYIQRRLMEEEENFVQAIGSEVGWENMSNLVLEKGCRAVFRITFDLPEGGFWTLCYKTLGDFPESKMWLNGQNLLVPFRPGQHVLPLPPVQSGKNELTVLADASSTRGSLESKPFTTTVHHFILMKTSQPVFSFNQHHCFFPGEGEVTVIYGGELSYLKIPETNFLPAAIQFSSLLVPTDNTGIITTRKSDGSYVDKNNQQIFLWGGHWNHVPDKQTVDPAVRLLPAMGVSSIRQIYGSESETDQFTGKWKPQALDNVFYQVAKFGQAGIYLDICLHSYGWYSEPDGAFYMAENGQDPRGRPVSRLWNPVYLRAQKNYARELLTTVNPYTGKKLVDDPTIVAVEIANEDYGLGARRFDFESLAEPEKTLVRKRFNDFLLAKYKTREKLAEAWAIEPLTSEEDPAKGTIHFPPQFKTVAKSPNFFYQWDAESRIASPRVSDALEWVYNEVYTFIKTMHDYLRSLGVKCSISWCGFSTYEIQMTNLHPYLKICDSLGGSAYGADTNFRSLERWYKFGSFNHFWSKSTHVREWSVWNQGADVSASTNGLVAAGLFGLAYGLDQWSHHKLGYGAYPGLEEANSSINPDTDQRRAPFSFVGWAFKRARLAEEPPRLLIGVPKTEACYGGLNSPCDTQPLKGGYSFLYDQVRMDYYLFDTVYDGPDDQVVLHEGRSPSGDYGRAKHAILWCHGQTDSTGRNKQAKEQWLALHGIEFSPGERWKKTDRFLAFNCDLVDNPELNQVLYDTLVGWGVRLPFSREEIHRLYATLDRSIEVNTDAGRMKVDRDDFQGWLGQNQGEETVTSLLNIISSSDQIQVLAIPFDTGSFQTARQVALWSRTNAIITLKLPFAKKPEIWAVNWLGYRKQRIYPLSWEKNSVTLRYQQDVDVHFYEILK